MAKQGISIRQAADRLTASGTPITEAALRKWIKKGLLKTLADGSLDPEMIEAQAALASKKQSPIHGGRREKGQLGGNEGEAAPVAGAKDMPFTGNPKNFEQARFLTELGKARQQQLDYATQTKELVARHKVEKALTDLGAMSRAVLERIPDRLAPVLAAEEEPHAVRMKLMAALNEAMEEIANTANHTAKRIAA